MTWDTSRTGIYRPSLMVERWGQYLADGLVVPPLMWQASLFIHKRVLSVYNPKRLS